MLKRVVVRIRVVRLFLLCLAAGTGAAVFGAEPALETAIASYETIETERVLDGVVEAINRATVSAQTTGRVAEIHFDVDDFVPANDVILRLHDTEQQARLARAEAEVRRAAASVEDKDRQFRRISELHAKRTVSGADYDRARTAADAAVAALEASQAELVRAREQAAYTVIRAPYSGIVTQRHIELGELVTPGTPLMSGFSLEHLRIRVEVPQRLIESVRRNQKARVLALGRDGESWDATELTVFPYATPGANTIPVRVMLPPAVEHLFPGMLVKVAFTVGERLRLAIPASAVVYRSEVVGVYTVGDDGGVSLRHVRAGHRADDGSIEILAGLDDGERVVLDPLHALARIKQSTISRADD